MIERTIRELTTNATMHCIMIMIVEQKWLPLIML